MLVINNIHISTKHSCAIQNHNARRLTFPHYNILAIDQHIICIILTPTLPLQKHTSTTAMSHLDPFVYPTIAKMPKLYRKQYITNQ